MERQPLIIVMAGPNGAGKSTAASVLIAPEIPYVNADEVAKGLPGYPSRKVDFLAAGVVLRAMDDYEDQRASFAVETTLATLTLETRVTRLRQAGYRFVLYFLWTPSPEFSMKRVAGRVRLGGHAIPEDTIRRRHKGGLKNLFQIYIPLADVWSVHNNATAGGPRCVAYGHAGYFLEVFDETKWYKIQKGGDHEA